jgi:hypothetical protein
MTSVVIRPALRRPLRNAAFATAVAVVGLITVAGPASAHDGDWRWRRHHEWREHAWHRWQEPGWYGYSYYHPYRYYAPGYYYSPPAVIYEPRPVYAAPPVYGPPVSSLNFVFGFR